MVSFIDKYSNLQKFVYILRQLLPFHDINILKCWSVHPSVNRSLARLYIHPPANPPNCSSMSIQPSIYALRHYRLSHITFTKNICIDTQTPMRKNENVSNNSCEFISQPKRSIVYWVSLIAFSYWKFSFVHHMGFGFVLRKPGHCSIWHDHLEGRQSSRYRWPNSCLNSRLFLLPYNNVNEQAIHLFDTKKQIQNI